MLGDDVSSMFQSGRNIDRAFLSEGPPPKLTMIESKSSKKGEFSYSYQQIKGEKQYFDDMVNSKEGMYVDFKKTINKLENQGDKSNMEEFEKYFSEIQADMISICLEYVNNRAGKIYLYASCEGNIIFSSFFYKINSMYVKKHNLNDAIDKSEERYDVSTERQFTVLDIINEDIKKIKNLCIEYERDVPTELKLIYDVKKNSLKAEYKYDLVYSNDSVKTANHVAMEWFEQIKLENND